MFIEEEPTSTHSFFKQKLKSTKNPFEGFKWIIFSTSNLSWSESEVDNEEKNIKQEVELNSITEQKDESDHEETKKGK